MNGTERFIMDSIEARLKPKRMCPSLFWELYLLMETLERQYFDGNPISEVWLEKPKSVFMEILQKGGETQK